MIKTSDVLQKDTLTEKEINLLKLRANRDRSIINNEQQEWQEEYNITPEQTAKGLAWLNNLRKTPKGAIRKNNPFGSREEYILDNFSHFTFTGLVDLANAFQVEHGIHFHVPCYCVYSKDGQSFEYHIKAGGVNIIG